MWLFLGVNFLRLESEVMIVEVFRLNLLLFMLLLNSYNVVQVDREKFYVLLLLLGGEGIVGELFVKGTALHGVHECVLMREIR